MVARPHSIFFSKYPELTHDHENRASQTLGSEIHTDSHAASQDNTFIQSNQLQLEKKLFCAYPL